MGGRMVNHSSGVRAPEGKRGRKEDEYWKALDEFGEEEAIFYLADLWGESTHSVKAFIDRIGDDIWL